MKIKNAASPPWTMLAEISLGANVAGLRGRSVGVGKKGTVGIMVWTGVGSGTVAVGVGVSTEV